MHTIAVAVLMVLLTSQAAAAASIPVKCQTAKQQEAGKLGACLHNAESKLVTSGDPGAYGAAVTKCTTKFSAQWQKVEQKAVDQGASCQTTGDEAAVEGAITSHVGCVTSELETGDTACLTCGNGIIDAGEDCDLGTVGGATCPSVSGGTLDIGTLGCSADCTFDTSACKHCPGQLVGGYCWLLGLTAQTCDFVCGTYGLTYDSATWFYAGSSGNDAQCGAVLTALGVPVGPISIGGPARHGCCFGSGTTRLREPLTTNSGSGHFSAQRACACK